MWVVPLHMLWVCVGSHHVVIKVNVESGLGNRSWLETAASVGGAITRDRGEIEVGRLVGVVIGVVFGVSCEVANVECDGIMSLILRNSSRSVAMATLIREFYNCLTLLKSGVYKQKVTESIRWRMLTFCLLVSFEFGRSPPPLCNHWIWRN